MQNTTGTETGTKTTDVLDIFHPLVKKWFMEHVGTPTDIQQKTWPEIAAKKHVLVTAPTGSGKTLTAFLWAIHNFITGPKNRESCRVLYISPLKALNNDIQRNLETPIQELKTYFNNAGIPFPNIRIAVRSGDTDPSERRRILQHPPDIFITTPESLNVLLTSKNGRRLLTGISTVILDEIHAVLPNKRGTYLISAIERLTGLSGEFQRIALSATVKPLETAADFMGGYETRKSGDDYIYRKRGVKIICSTTQKQFDIRVQFPGFSKTGKPNSEIFWPGLVEELRQIISSNRSSLFFANSRRMVEKVARLLNEAEGDRVYSHHGSLSKEIRSAVEKRFKDGELSAIIATSSLELGIDIGSVDEVVLIQPPFSIASAVQRIGRAGHGVGQVSRGSFYPIHPRSLVDCAVIAGHIDAEAIETMKPVDAPLDVLAQVILSMTISEPKNIDDLFGEIRASYPYHNLSRKEFDLVLQMLAGRYADSRLRELKPRAVIDKIKNTVKTRENSELLLYTSGGVIPDRGYFNLRIMETKAKIGELDEEFVWERSLGDAFPLGNQIWRIQRITHNDVEVTQVTKSNSLVPFWRAEDINRSYHLSQKIGDFLETADKNINSPTFSQQLAAQNHLSPRAASELTDFLKRQKKETHAPLPHRHHILVEHFHDPVNRSDAKQTIIHTLWGGPVNRPFALAFAAAWEEKYRCPLNVFVNNDCIMLNLPHSFNTGDILDLVPSSSIRKLLRAKLESTGYFGARFRENAQRALLLPKQSFHRRMPLWLNRLRSKKLLDAISTYEDFPILLETWRTCLNHDFEIDTLANLLDEIKSNTISITEVYTKTPSPFADNIIWRQTNQYMYEDDSPHPRLRSNLNDSLLKEVLYSSLLRPKFPETLLKTFQQKLHRTAEGYSPGSPEELLLWVNDRILIPLNEWNELLNAIQRDHAITPEEITQNLDEFLFFIEINNTITAIASRDNLPLIHQTLSPDFLNFHSQKIPTPSLQLEPPPNDQDPNDLITRLLTQFLRFYGPISFHFLQTTLGIPPENLTPTLETLTEEGRIIIDEFRTNDSPTPTKTEICDTENLEILLRMRRTQARPSFEPLEIQNLPLFIASYHDITSPGNSMNDLQQTLQKLFGYPAKTSLWETDILPSRLNPYFPSWLDTSLHENDLIWFGCGLEQIGFCFEPDYELFARKDRDQEPFCKRVPGPPKTFVKVPGLEKTFGKATGLEKTFGKAPDVPKTFGKVPGPGNTFGVEEENEAEEENGNTGFDTEISINMDTTEDQKKILNKIKKILTETRGKYELNDLMDLTGLSSAELTPILWKMTWAGLIGNDDFKVIRNGVMNRFKPEEIHETRQVRSFGSGRPTRRLGFNRWHASRPFSGNWYALPAVEHENLDALDLQELTKDRIRLLFMRYGILFRELVWNELPMLRWSAIFPVLRLMELSGEIVSGHFFKGIPGLQFCTPNALGILTRGLPHDAIYWMNATDPASLCGIGLEELKPSLPHRIPTTHIVFHGSKPVLISKKNGKELLFLVEPDNSSISQYLEFFKTLIAREFQPLKYIGVETVNDMPVLESPYKEKLKEFGFKKDYKSMLYTKDYS